MVVTGIFEDNYQVTLSISDAIISGFDSSKEQDSQVVTVGYAILSVVKPGRPHL